MYSIFCNNPQRRKCSVIEFFGYRGKNFFLMETTLKPLAFDHLGIIYPAAGTRRSILVHST